MRNLTWRKVAFFMAVVAFLATGAAFLQKEKPVVLGDGSLLYKYEKYPDCPYCGSGGTEMFIPTFNPPYISMGCRTCKFKWYMRPMIDEALLRPPQRGPEANDF